MGLGCPCWSLNSYQSIPMLCFGAMYETCGALHQHAGEVCSDTEEESRLLRLS